MSDCKSLYRTSELQIQYRLVNKSCYFKSVKIRLICQICVQFFVFILFQRIKTWNTDGADWTDCRGFHPSLNIELQIRKSRIVESPIVEFSIRIKVMSDYKSLDRASELQIRKSRIANSEEHKSSDKAISLAY
jgi:hypothetical protein